MKGTGLEILSKDHYSKCLQHSCLCSVVSLPEYITCLVSGCWCSTSLGNHPISLSMQGLGLFADRDLEKHTMVIEYIGQLISNEVAEKREKIYEQQVSEGAGVKVYLVTTE